MKKLIIDKIIDEFTDLKSVYPKTKTIDVINLLQVIKQEQNDKFYSKEDMKIAFKSNIKDWISFEEFIETFKNK